MPERTHSQCRISGRLHRLGKAEYNIVGSNPTTGSKTNGGQKYVSGQNVTRFHYLMLSQYVLT